MHRKELAQILEQTLMAQPIKDFCPNGLQVEGRAHINKVVTGVTASQALVDKAVALEADALIVHHGYFWKGESQAITGMKKRRIEALLSAGINLFAYHLPLDIHPQLGNNAQLAQLLDIEIQGPMESGPSSVPVWGRLRTPLSGQAFADKIAKALSRTPLASVVRDEVIETVGLCTGGGQGYIDLAASLGLDAYLTGEASEQTIHSSREQGVDFFAAGHHATERYGAKALGEFLAREHHLDVTFIDIDNPV
ncbi:Nif3-like dinuclear metal center hexameric protein [Pseudoalteromonas sp. Cnat2-41]|uniref:Nif3-like dinuclear metal center hexameric protein n=1 Tax=unclassified Pseudoalteromonas TaxID=194690 RepID=UPI001EF78F34|nr:MULTISPECIES: Nif3-like dinuclear metal center hexameric protein [unclassified Pseudoalteromonas]MCF2862946.1 Nif3-like dinuclear metal center hexameric protein [Pseudoalteromonas sp. CNAT2-18]MCG7559098.1 Nif3-like dinuclear metal center hexameric protein [Pseudoalteromonas sp. CNAT2-18.1]